MREIIRGLQGHHEPREEKVFHEVLKFMPEGAVMLELGSFWAYYSLWFAKSVQNAKNYVIEPCAERLELTIKNFELNDKIAYYMQASIGLPIGTGYFRDAKCVGIDGLLKANQIDHLHLLRADIQTLEYFMLKSAEESIPGGKIDYFFISTHDKWHPHCLDFLLSYDFTIVAEYGVKEDYSEDGLIVAKRKGVAGPRKAH